MRAFRDYAGCDRRRAAGPVTLGEDGGERPARPTAQHMAGFTGETRRPPPAPGAVARRCVQQSGSESGNTRAATSQPEWRAIKVHESSADRGTVDDSLRPFGVQRPRPAPPDGALAVSRRLVIAAGRRAGGPRLGAWCPSTAQHGPACCARSSPPHNRVTLRRSQRPPGGTTCPECGITADLDPLGRDRACAGPGSRVRLDDFTRYKFLKARRRFCGWGTRPSSGCSRGRVRPARCVGALERGMT